jgi:pimeloyl-ACP methyl ester carboxylesterase
MQHSPATAIPARRSDDRALAARGLRARFVTALLVAPVIGLGSLGGCSLVKLKQDASVYYASTVLVGRVDCPGSWQGPLIVAAYTRIGDRVNVAHQTLLHECGSYELIVQKGKYALFAFGDLDGNGRFDAGEPVGHYPGSAAVPATGTGVVGGLDFVVARGGPDDADPPVPYGTAFNPPAAPLRSTQVGALADLDAPAFSAASGERGYWAPVETFRSGSGNIHFLEAYDPKKIPILFVHGAAGSAQDWRYFFAHIDRTRYQPWFFQYPSGAALDSMAYLLYWKLLNLQRRYHFETLYLAAHSMGGLVTRQFLLNFGQQFPQIKLFVSVSTPWAGEASAELGVKHSPAVVPSWVDMQPEGTFIRGLFARHLPPQIPYYLFFGHKGGYSLLRPNNDGTVTLASELRDAAQAEARRVYGFDEDHVGILSSPRVLRQFQAVVDAVDGTAAGGAASGQLKVVFTTAANDDLSGAAPTLVLYPAGRAGPDKANDASPQYIALSATDSGRPIGPIPPGDYEVGLFASAYRSTPARQHVHVDATSTPSLDFRLQPQGVISGYVGADQPASERPAGSYRPPHPSVKITRITLTGAGVTRTLTPRADGATDLLPSYLAGRDDASGSMFSFVALPPGTYMLNLAAEGYQPYQARYVVVPGQPGPLLPIVLTRKR